ncbi:unnamed protein product [Angiostrongylus costaricensis]|uniref:Uncharacterized protein n=1 Tax=Angiostrongylus costaricensis TaxID=334426 RepID=A0A0R3PS47_ANGCS|nr:unnamed protein product [Angiostrongylus costaricensis]
MPIELHTSRAGVLLRCLKATRFIDNQNVHEKTAEPEPTSNDVVKMILLANNRLTDAFIRDVQYVIISAIVRQVWTVCRCDWVDRFCIARSLYSMLNEMFDERTVRSTIKEIHHEVNMLRAASEQLWAKFDVEIWLKTGCCALLRSERAMQRVMDKLCTGINVIPLVKALAVDYLQSAEERFGQGLTNVAEVTPSEDGELRMVNRAIEAVLYETMQKKPARISETRTRNAIS